MMLLMRKTLPFINLQNTMSFYERLGFDTRSEENGDDLILVLECQDIHLILVPEKELNPFKNPHVRLVDVENLQLLGEQFVARYRPEESECAGWVESVKNGEVHIVDPNGNLIMLSRKRVA